jgi:hypothetical protein
MNKQFIHGYRFTLEGNRIVPDCTVEELGLKNGDVLDFLEGQSGGHRPTFTFSAMEQKKQHN